MIYTPILKYDEFSGDYRDGKSLFFVCGDDVGKIFGRVPRTIRFEIDTVPREGWTEIYLFSAFPGRFSLWVDGKKYSLFHQRFVEWLYRNLEHNQTYWVRMVTDV